MQSPHQAQFDKKYISATEICQYLQVTKPVINHLRANDVLPFPIQVTERKSQIWVREEVMPKLETYKNELDAKRSSND